MKALDPRFPPTPLLSLFRRREMLGGLIGSAIALQLHGCGGSDASSGAASSDAVSNPQPTPTGPEVGVTVEIASSIAGQMPAQFLGLSYDKSQLAQPLFQAGNTDLAGLFRLLGTDNVLRIGAGDADSVIWNANGAGRTSGYVSPPDIRALADFVQSTGWSVLYCVNLATGTSAQAAEEVAYVAQVLGAQLYGIEIGNEPDLFSKYYIAGFDLQMYEQRWEEFRQAILQLTPSVAITGPATTDGVMNSWTIPFANYAGRQLSMLTEHYYRADGHLASSTAQLLISPDPALDSLMSELKTEADSLGIPVRIAECNSFYNSGRSGVSDSYASSLWVIDFLFHVALGGGKGVNLHGGGDGPGYTPIADQDGTIVAVRPEYYGVLLVAEAGQGNLLTTSVSAHSLNVTAYAVSDSNGRLNVIIVNKDADNTMHVTLTLAQSVTTGQLWLMRGPSLLATSGVTIQDLSIPLDGSFSLGTAYSLSISNAQTSCYVPPLSAALIRFS